MKYVRGNLIALLAVAALALAGQREATAARCKADGETCRRSRSCCGTSGHNGVCVKASGAKFGVCCTPDCTGKECGDDGCGGSCGTCPAPAICTGGTCTSPCNVRCGGTLVGECKPNAFSTTECPTACAAFCTAFCNTAALFCASSSCATACP